MEVETLKRAIDKERKSVPGLPANVEDRHLETAARAAFRYHNWAKKVGRNLDDIFQWSVRAGIRTLLQQYKNQVAEAEQLRRSTPVGNLNESLMVERASELRERVGLVEQKYSSIMTLEQKQEMRVIQEELSSGDWNRFGVFYGVLWYKVDKMIRALEAIERNTK